jgi:gas vesicle protein
MQKASSNARLALALGAGLAAGIAAVLFLRSDKGQELSEDAKKMAKQLQQQITKKIEAVSDLTKETYSDLVDEILSHYKQAKSLAEDEQVRLKTFLVDQWDDLKERINDKSDEA